MRNIRAFACRVAGSSHETVINELSSGRAKSEFMRHLDMDTIPFTDVRVRTLGQPVTTEGINRVAKYRGVPFVKAGMRCQVGESGGSIVGHNASANFDVLFEDGPYKGQTLNCHPLWEIAYYDTDGNVLADFRTTKT